MKRVVSLTAIFVFLFPLAWLIQNPQSFARTNSLPISTLTPNWGRDTIVSEEGDTMIVSINDIGDTVVSDSRGQIILFDPDNAKLTINLAKLKDKFKKQAQKDAVSDTSTTLAFPFRDNENSPALSQKQSNLYLPTDSMVKTDVEYDSKTQQYSYTQKIGKYDYRSPMAMTLDDYKEYDFERGMNNYWRQKVRSESMGRQKGFMPKLNIGIEGFDKIFGSSTIDIKPQGAAELTFGVNINRVENPTLPVNLQRNVNFDFGVKIQMSVNGKIGDKVAMGISYNTEAAFDFENTVKIGYTGDEDEIIKSLEAGNVSLPLNGSLITGSSSLMGFKTQMQFGKLTVTSIFSQQKGKSSQIEVKGGAQTSTFKVRADEYEANRHFFISQYFKDHYEEAMSILPNLKTGVTITRVEVWVTNKTKNYEQSRNILALMDLAENDANIYNKHFTQQLPYDFPTDSLNDLYQVITTDYAQIRDFYKITGLLGGASQNFIEGQDFEKVENARLLSQTEFTFSPNLGFISLRSSLNADEVLAVAFEYSVDGRVFRVGEFSNSGIAAPKTLVVKLLKPTNLSPKLPNWHLMMKNIYSLGAYQVNTDNFMLQVMYQNDKTGTAINYIPEGKKPENGGVNGKLLLQVLNLDNLDNQRSPNPDGMFDFLPSLTINANEGRIIFPVLQPFGKYLRKKIADDKIADKYVFQELYDSTQSKAQQIAEKNKFFMEGTYQSSSGSDIQLNATNIPQGSVVVTAGGMKLTENVDYNVDYMLGRVTILNQGYLASGTPIKVSLESNQLFNLGTKVMLGTHLDYKFSDNFNLGGTVLNLTEKPLTNKVTFGDEPISNTIWGLDAQYSTEVPFLTKLIDNIPFIDTKEKSTITMTGEFAKLVPGHSRAIGKKGETYIDDFEGSKTSYDIRAYSGWYLSSTPQGQPDMFPEGNLTNNLKYGFNRARLAWYSVMSDLVRSNSSTPDHLRDDAHQQSNHFVREVFEQEIFPNKESPNGYPVPLPVLNIAYYPSEKGPYNFDVAGVDGISYGMNPDGTLRRPNTRWAGIMRKITNSDFEAANIEFIEFWMMDPFVYDTLRSGGDFYINLGNISEDVLKDSRKSFENGLTANNDSNTVDFTVWGRVPRLSSQTDAFDNNADSRKYQDVGLDGLSTNDEKAFFTDYISEVVQNFGQGSQAYTNAMTDPASDDYHFFKGGDYDQKQYTILDRYKNFNNSENNSPTDAQNPESYPTSYTLTPDIEDINNDNTLSESESYYQYHIHLSPEEMQVGKNYITNIVTDTRPRKDKVTSTVRWYQFKVPIYEPEAKVGNIQDFKSIRFMRMFLRNFNDTTILRFGTLDLVRGEWRKYQSVLLEGSEEQTYPQIGTEVFDISAVNIEENSSKTPVNYVLPPGVTRIIDPFNPAQSTQLNEQSISLKVCELEDGHGMAAYKNVELDVRQYKKLQMYIHVEAVDDERTLQNGELTAFIRLGSDYKQNYYEYEIPLETTPFITKANFYNNNSEFDRQKVWPDSNRLDLDFEILQQVKQARNLAMRQNPNITLSTVYRMYQGKNKVKVVGTPNLSNIRTIMIGVRNPARGNNPDDDGSNKCGEVWMDELRLTDFREEGGWAAQGRITAKLADFATVTLAGNTSTPGFGSIEKKINERQKETIKQYDFSSNVELGKFFPQKYGVKIPLYVGLSEGFSDPQYNPLDPDIPFSDVLNSNEYTQAEKDSIKHISQSYTRRRSINLTNVKVNGNSEPSKGKSGETPKQRFYNISNFSVSYSFNELYTRNINTEYDRLKNYSGSINYLFSHRPKSIEPFKKSKFLSKPAFRIVKDFNFTLLPQQFSFRTEMTRMYHESQLRNISNPYIIILPVYQKDFRWTRDYGVKWDLAKMFKIDITANNQSRFDEPQGRLDENGRDSLWSKIYGMESSGRTTKYEHKINVNWTLPINKIPFLNWVTATARYNSTFDWNAGALRNDSLNFGNTIQNANQIQLNGQVNFQQLYNKVPYLKKVDDKYKSLATNTQKKKLEPVEYEEKDVKLRAKQDKTINHKLDTDKEIEVKLFDENNKEVKVAYEVVNGNKVKITPETDVTKGRIKVTGKREPKLNIIKELADFTLNLMMSVQNVSLTYSKDNSSALPGYTPKTKMMGLEELRKNAAPGLPFVFGWQDENFAQHAADNHWITTDTLLNTAYMMANKETFTFRGTLEPFPDVKIDINANRNYAQNQSEFYVADRNGTFNPRNRTVNGNFSMSYFTFNTSFWKLGKNDYSSKAFDNFKKYRIEIAKRIANLREAADIFNKYDQTVPNLDPTTQLPIENGYPNGYSPQSQEVLLPAFLAAYSNRDANKIELDVFPKVPLPNWAITYDGLAKFAGLKKYFKTISVRHSYVCTYKVGRFANDQLYSENSSGYSFVRDQLNMFIPKNQIATVSLDETFSPFLSIDMTWNNSLSTKVEYKKSRSLEFSFTSNQLYETQNNEYVVGAGYRFKELPIIVKMRGKTKKFKSDLNIRTDFSLKDMKVIARQMDVDLNTITQGNKNITIDISADYVLNEQFTLKAFYNQDIRNPLVSSSFRSSNTKVGISVRFNLIQ